MIGHTDGVDHLVLGSARMHVTTCKGELGSCSVEVLELQLSYLTTIEGIGEVATKAFHIKLMGTQANLFVRIEGNANLSVLDFRMLHQVFHTRDAFGNACFIVRTQQGVAIGNDEVFAHMVLQFWELRRAQHDKERCGEGECNGPAEYGSDVFTGTVRRAE